MLEIVLWTAAVFLVLTLLPLLGLLHGWWKRRSTAKADEADRPRARRWSWPVVFIGGTVLG
jgi:hypothetical protein